MESPDRTQITQLDDVTQKEQAMSGRGIKRTRSDENAPASLTMEERLASLEQQRVADHAEITTLNGKVRTLNGKVATLETEVSAINWALNRREWAKLLDRPDSASVAACQTNMNSIMDRHGDTTLKSVVQRAGISAAANLNAN
jgi:chromosome segregation ATPase